MDANEIIRFIHEAPKKTPVKAYLKLNRAIDAPDVQQFGVNDTLLIGELSAIEAIMQKNADAIDDAYIECDRRNSAVPLLDIRHINARIEPGAIIRDRVLIGDRAVIMMGAVINIGAVVGEETMIDMGAVLGGRATVGKRCHIGAGAVLAGVVEPASATPVIVEDNVLIGANAVVLEGVRIGQNAVVAAGSIVIRDVNPNEVVAGVPAKVIKIRDAATDAKTGLIDALRTL